MTAARRIVPPETGATFDTQNAVPVADAAQVIALGLLLFGIVAGLAAIVACAQALLRQTATESADRSVLSALGTTRAARLWSAILTLLPSVVLGVVLGVGTAYVASGWMPIAIARRAEPSPGRQFDVLVLGLGALAVVTGLVVLAAASAWVVDRRATHPRRRTTRHVQLPAGNAAPRAVGLRYAFPSGRGAAPSRTAIAAIAAATAGVVGVIAFSASLDHLVHTPALYGWTFDAVGVDAEHVDAVRADPGVAGVAQVRGAALARSRRSSRVRLCDSTD